MKSKIKYSSNSILMIFSKVIVICVCGGYKVDEARIVAKHGA